MSTRDKKDPSLTSVLACLNGMSNAAIERKSGVCAATVGRWRNGRARSPQNKTLEFALRAAGFKRIIVPKDHQP